MARQVLRICRIYFEFIVDSSSRAYIEVTTTESGRFVDQQPPRDRARNLVDLLVPDWRPTASQVLWGIRIALVLGILVLIGYPYGITLWEWAQLLIVPAVIAAGGAWFNSRQNARERFTQEQRTQDEALQKYVDYISKVITDGKLYRSSDDLSLKEARITIRAQTLAVLTRLSDPYRKASVLQFMYEAGLIDGEDPFVSVLGANLQGVNLSKIGSTLEGINLRYASLNKGILSQASMPNAYLNRADLTGANLTCANLTGADLRGTNLTDATLESAYLWNAKLDPYVEEYSGEPNETPTKLHNSNLSGAHLEDATGISNETLEQQARSLRGATMPDGSKHD
jgi:uncharacterized protein YjbI with pentapeptide repeats